MIYNNDFFKKIESDLITAVGERRYRAEISFAKQILNSGKFDGCEAVSVLAAVKNIVQCGLSLNPILGYASMKAVNENRKFEEGGRWRDNWVKVCDWEPEYKGLIKLITDSPEIEDIEARVIYQGDFIDFDYSHPDRVLKHTPWRVRFDESKPESKGDIVAAYSLAYTSKGRKLVEYAEIEEIYNTMRDRSTSYAFAFDKHGKLVRPNTPWIKDEPEMIKKGMIKRHSKTLPKGSNYEFIEPIMEAVAKDHQGYIVSASESAISFIESLMEQHEEILGTDYLDINEALIVGPSKDEAVDITNAIKECVRLHVTKEITALGYEIGKPVIWEGKPIMLDHITPFGLILGFKMNEETGAVTRGQKNFTVQQLKDLQADFEGAVG